MTSYHDLERLQIDIEELEDVASDLEFSELANRVNAIESFAISNLSGLGDADRFLSKQI